ncbi:MAG: hypothetical protein ACE5FD_12980, partial [Anaerolineae bacterium]
MSNFDTTLFVNQEKKFRGFQKLLQAETRQAVMLIEAAQDMGKSWLLGRMEHHCQAELTAVPTTQIDFRNPLELHEIQDSLGLIRLLRDKLGDTVHFNALNSTINSFTEAQSGSQNRGLALLGRNIETYFNLEELKVLCFDLDINYENLAGQTLAAKSRELVNYCQRHNLLADLLAACQESRPEVDWQEGMALDEGTAVSPTTTADHIPDNNAPIWADSDMERRRAERQINDAFFECLTAIAQNSEQIVFLFDSFETAPDTAQNWIKGELLPRLRDGRLSQITIIITGRKTPDLTDLEMKPLLVQTSLDPFTEQDVREYFEEKRQISGLDFHTIMLTSGGVP